MINLNKIKTKNMLIESSRQMTPIYVMGTTEKERDYRKFGPTSVISFECSKDVNFDDHNSAIVDNLYLYNIDTIERDIDENNKHVHLLAKSMCFAKLDKKEEE